MPTAIVVLADSRQSGTCRSCGAPIEWAIVLGTSRRMPFDPPIVLCPSDAWDTVAPAVLRIDMTQTRTHFVTCPHADQWRRSK
jgi:hypothetical protein